MVQYYFHECRLKHMKLVLNSIKICVSNLVEFLVPE